MSEERKRHNHLQFSGFQTLSRPKVVEYLRSGQNFPFFPPRTFSDSASNKIYIKRVQTKYLFSGSQNNPGKIIHVIIRKLPFFNTCALKLRPSYYETVRRNSCHRSPHRLALTAIGILCKIFIIIKMGVASDGLSGTLNWEVRMC